MVDISEGNTAVGGFFRKVGAGVGTRILEFVVAQVPEHRIPFWIVAFSNQTADIVQNKRTSSSGEPTVNWDEPRKRTMKPGFSRRSRTVSTRLKK